MELLEDIRFFEETGKFPSHIIREAVYQQGLFDSLLEEGEVENTPERMEVLRYINNDQYIRNKYNSFVKEVAKNKRSEFLTPYTADDFVKGNVQTFQVPGYEIGFALKPLKGGNFDIISVHNNTDIHGIGEALIDSAIRLGGTHLDHYDGYLSDFYKKKGFRTYKKYKWNPDYAPNNWDYDKYGTPDVHMRRLRKPKAI